MNPKIKTTNDQWRTSFIVLCIMFTLIFSVMAGRIIQDDFKMKIMDLECNKSVEEAIEQGKNITIKEIIEKKEYPVKYKGNEDIIWLNKEELYLFG